MRWDVYILSANDYILPEILSPGIPEKYFTTDEGHVIIACATFSTEKIIYQLLHFLFRGSKPVIEVFRDNYNYVLDLSPLKEQIIDMDYLELNYPKWLEETGRPTSMGEYGQLLTFIGFARQSKNKKHLLLLVSRADVT